MREFVERYGPGRVFDGLHEWGRVLLDRHGAGRLWVATVVTLAAIVGLAIAAFPKTVYVDVIWQYYWGPVVADAQGWACVAWNGGAQVECAPDAEGPTATPGYTWQSYAGYIPTLILMLTGIIILLRWLDVQRFRATFYALFPFMLFGGALRTVEDASVAAGMLIDLPWAALLISPFIYGTVFLIALGALVFSVWLERAGYVSGHEYPLAGIGTLALALSVGYLASLAATEPFASFHVWILVLTLVGSTLVTAIAWYAIVTLAPDLNRGTGYMGLVVIWAHAVDGVANVIGLDWAVYLGWEQNLAPKHPINEAIVTYTGSLLPETVTAYTGEAWPFLLVKVAAAVVIIAIFDEEFFEESPRYAILLMITVVAVGLGPGTRDMLRATFGV